MTNRRLLENNHHSTNGWIGSDGWIVKMARVILEIEMKEWISIAVLRSFCEVDCWVKASVGEKN